MQIGNEDDSLRRRLVQLTHLYFRETFQELQKIGIHPKQVPFMILLSDHEGGQFQRSLVSALLRLQYL